MRLFLYNKVAIFGKGKKKVSVITRNDAQPGVQAVTNADARPRPAIKSSPNSDSMDARVRNLEDSVQQHSDCMKQVLLKLDLLLSHKSPGYTRKRSPSPYRPNSNSSPRLRSRSPSPGACFGCGELGHFQNECPNTANKRVVFDDSLKS